MTNENGTNRNGAMFSEAPGSINFKFDYKGYKGIMLTLRAETGKEVLSKLDGAISALDKMGATPAGGNASASANVNGNAPMCPTHGTPGLKSKHGNGYYCPQKVAESGGGQDGSKPLYCKAKLV